MKKKMMNEYFKEMLNNIDKYDTTGDEEFPYSKGQMEALRAYEEALEFINCSILPNEDCAAVVNECLWDRDIPDFVETLQKAGIKEFHYISKNTGLLENIYYLAQEGWWIEGTCRITRRPTNFYNREYIAVVFKKH